MSLPGRRGILLAVAAAAVLAYANAVPNGFALDDDAILVKNDVVTQGRVGEALASPWWRVDRQEGILYRPVTLAAFAAEWALWGDEPWGVHAFHAANVLWHAAASALVALLFLHLVPPAAALFGGLLFAVHPVHVEAVANVVGRAEVMATVGVLAGCLLFLRRPASPWGRAGRVAGVAAAYAFALGSKEIGVTLPGLLILLVAYGAGDAGRRDAPPLDRGTGSGGDGEGAAGDGEGVAGPAGGPGLRPPEGRGLLPRLRDDLPLWLLLASVLGSYLVLRMWVLGTLVGEELPAELVGTTVGERLLTALTLWPEYARLMVLPLDLVADYGPAVLEVARGVTPAVVAGAAILAAVLGLAVALRRSAWSTASAPQRWAGPAAGLGLAWFFVAVLPVAHLGVHAGVLLAERTLYLPSAGALLALAVGGAVVVERLGWPGRRVAVAAGVVVLLLGARTVARNPVWDSTLDLMRNLALDHPESHRAHRLYADFLERSGRTEEAAEAYRRAVETHPNRYDVLMEAADFFVGAGRPGEAERLADRARELWPRRRTAHTVLAESHLRQREGLAAHRAVARGVAAAGADASLWAHLSEAYLLRGDLEAALRARRAALAADPRRPDDWRRLAEILTWLERDPALVERARERAGELEAAGAGAEGGAAADPIRVETRS